MTYFITFACYGARLHGNDTGSVDRSHNAYGTRILEPNQARSTSALGRMIQTPYVLDPPQRSLVLSCLRDVCTYRNWNLLAAHVRTNHVHVVVVVGAAEKPESVMNTLKAYASRKLNESGLEASDRRRWSRHGSTRYLWSREQVQDAVSYVADGQGKSMLLYVNQELYR
jgi:REP element-mobilizing transposase RayT